MIIESEIYGMVKRTSYQLKGYTLLDGKPVKRGILAVDRHSGILIGATTSFSDTGFWAIRYIPDSHVSCVLQLDYTGVHESLSFDSVTTVQET